MHVSTNPLEKFSVPAGLRKWAASYVGGVSWIFSAFTLPLLTTLVAYSGPLDERSNCRAAAPTRPCKGVGHRGLCFILPSLFYEHIAGCSILAGSELFKRSNFSFVPYPMPCLASSHFTARSCLFLTQQRTFVWGEIGNRRTVITSTQEKLSYHCLLEIIWRSTLWASHSRLLVCLSGTNS